MFSWNMTKSFLSQICFNIYYLQKFYLNEKLDFYYHIYWELSKLMQGQTNKKVPSNILPLYKVSFSVCLVSTFGVRVHHRKTCTSKGFIKKIVHHIVHLEQPLSFPPTHQTIGFWGNKILLCLLKII